MTKYSLCFSLLFISAVLFTACKKENQIDESYSEVSIDNIYGTYNGRIVYEARTNKIDLDLVDFVGICWSKTNELPNLDDEYNKTSLKEIGQNFMKFEEEFHGFDYGTTYYFRAFLKREDETHYFSDTREVNFQPGWKSAGGPNSDVSISQTHFVNPTTGYVSGSYPGGYGLLYKTVDGGESWTTLESFDAILTEELMFVSEDKGYRVCHTGSDNMLQRTDNGGLYWSTLDYVEDVSIISMSTVDENTIFIATANNYIKKSTNSGGFWTHSVLLELHELDRIRDIAFLDESTGFVVTKHGNVYKSINGGITWDLICPLVAIESKQICVVDASTSFIMSEKSVYKTTDGGFTWSLKHNISHSHEFNFSIDFANDQFGAFGGLKTWTSPTDGYIIMTRDGGETWDEKWNLTFGAREIQLLSTEVGFGAGYHLYKYK